MIEIKKMEFQDMDSLHYEGWHFFWDKYWWNNPKNDVKLEYVHQLQNLYFVLTGKELEWKEA